MLHVFFFIDEGRTDHEVAHAASCWRVDRARFREKKFDRQAARKFRPPECFFFLEVFAIIICKLNLPRIWQARAFLSFIFLETLPKFRTETKEKRNKHLSPPPLYRVGILCFDSAVTHTYGRQVLSWWLWNDVTSSSERENDQPDPGIVYCVPYWLVPN